MDRSALLEQVRIALATVLNRELPELAEDTRLFEDLALDSTSVIELLIILEDDTGLEVDPDELEPEAFQTVGNLTDYLETSLTGAMAGRSPDQPPAVALSTSDKVDLQAPL